MLIVIYLVLLKFLVNFGKFSEDAAFVSPWTRGQLFERRESEVVKTSGSSDDNKKEFFETASHVLKNSGLFQGADVWTPFKARGCERSVQLRANKRGFFKIAPHILENHRLLLRSCFLNAVYSFLEILKETEPIFGSVSLFILFLHLVI